MVGRRKIETIGEGSFLNENMETLNFLVSNPSYFGSVCV